MEITSADLPTPIFQQDHPNDEIVLGEFPATITINGKPYTANSRWIMRFAPVDRIEIEMAPPPDDPWSFIKLFSDSIDLKFEYRGGGSLQVLMTSSNGVFVPSRSPIDLGTPRSDFSSAKAHLFNFPNFYGSSERSLVHRNESGSITKSSRLGFIQAELDGWAFEITALEDTDRREKELKSTGGFVLTHIVLIRRANGSPFSEKELKSIINTLQLYLSFVGGAWAALGMVVAFDRKGECAWESWGFNSARRGPIRLGNTCFDRMHGDWISDRIHGFGRIYHNPVWKVPLRDSLYWYMVANSREEIGTEGAIIMAQTALELLAWNHCVVDKKIVSKVAFQHRGLPAADKFRIFFSTLQIPLEIPDTLKKLNSRPAKKWVDAMALITDVRNSLVHPESDLQLDSLELHDVWRLMMWYLDLAFLRLMGADGAYRNRVSGEWVGNVDTLPWSKQLTPGEP
jgi:hypothetical protein